MAEEIPLELTVTGHVTESSTLSDEGLRVLNQVLSRLTIRQTVFSDGERAELTIDQNAVWAVERRVDDAGTVVIFSDTQGYKTAADEPDALMLLSGMGREVHIPLFAPDAYEKSAAEGYALLQMVAEPVPQKGSATVQNAAASPRYDRYTLTAEQMNGLWPGIVAAAQPFFDQDGGQKEHFQAAACIEFIGDVRVKRLYDAAGQDMGVQITGNGVLLGTERKITLLMGYTKGKGGSFTLSAKAIKGKDSLKINATLKEKSRDGENNYVLSCDYSHIFQGETESGTFMLDLLEKPDGWSGQAAWQQGNKSLTVEGDMLDTLAGMQGTVYITSKEKKKVLFRAEVMLMAEQGQEPERMDVPVMDLSGMTQGQARAALHPQEMILMRALVYLLNDLPDDDRWLLTHELRTDHWHSGSDVPVVNEEEQWIVEEDEP